MTHPSALPASAPTADEATPPRPASDAATSEQVSVADITERLMAEFDGQIQVATISDVVLGCQRDLRGSPVPALPELVERLARQRLLHPAAG